MLEKLINEHGSAKILKERLGLKDDQIKLIQDEFSALKSENLDLKTDNENLKISLEQAKQETNRLKEIIESSAEPESTNELSEIEANILQHLFKTNTDFRIEQIAQFINKEPNVAKYHMNNLHDKNFLYSSMRVGAPTTYKINNEGIKFVVENLT